MSRYRIVRIPHPEQRGDRYDVERRYNFIFWEWLAGFDTLIEAELYAKALRASRAVVKKYS